LPDEIFSLIVGVPVKNCDGRDTNVTDTSSGSITVGDTWSAGATVGLDFGPLKIEATGGWSQTKSTEWGQSIAITVEPGQMGVLVANVQYKRTSGTVQIGDGEDFPVVSNQPVNIVSYGPASVPCGSQFSANASSPFNCTSNAQVWWKGNAPSATSLAPMIAIVLLSISLLA